jgi:superoxide dismutase, Fe-Mn family
MRQVTAAAFAGVGSGWAMMVTSPLDKKLEMLIAEKHPNLTQRGAIPLDVWEHAYN